MYTPQYLSNINFINPIPAIKILSIELNKLTSDLLHSKNVFCNAKHSGGQFFSFKQSLGNLLS